MTQDRLRIVSVYSTFSVLNVKGPDPLMSVKSSINSHPGKLVTWFSFIRLIDFIVINVLNDLVRTVFGKIHAELLRSMELLRSG